MTPDLESAIKENVHWLRSISAERIREELEKILTSNNVAAGLRTLVRLGLMLYIVPEFMETLNIEQEAEFHHKDVFEHTLIVTQNVENDPILRKAAFFHDIGKPRTLIYEYRCTYCGAKSTGKHEGEGECECCGGRTMPKKIHFYGHENVGAAIARTVMKRLAYPKDDIDAVAHLVANHMRPYGYAASREPWRQGARQCGCASQARPGGYNRQRPEKAAHSRGVLAQPQSEGGRDTGFRRRGEAHEPPGRQRADGAF
jgi:putative nucleotidyltransferase with HDIG domain